MRGLYRLALAAGLAALAGAASGAVAPVVISEIHYHPVEEPAFNADGTPYLDLSNDVHEFVEVQNTTATAIDLGGWTLAGGIGYTFPSGTTLAAGGFRVIAKTPARLATVYSLTASTVLGPYTGYLANGSDTVRLRDASGTLIDSLTYHSAFPWPGSADALGAQDRFTGLTTSSYRYKGRSLQRVSVDWPSGDPANWLASPLTGPTPGAAQAVTRTVPKPVVVAQSAVQSSDGAVVVRAASAVTVNCTFSATDALSAVTLEYFADDVNSTSETHTSVVMTELGSGSYAATIPGQADRTIVRYRFKANRGDGLEVVSPRADDPQIAPVGAGGALEAWHGYFVTPVRTSSYPIYDVFVASAALTQLNTNITQNPKRVTAASASGLPRAVPYVAATAAQWNGTQAAVFACNGELWDIHIRYHGSLYHRAASNNSFKLHFPEYHLFNAQSSWFITGHGTEFIEAQKLNRLLGLPASKMRTVAWYYNSNAMITRSEQGEYAKEMLDEYHELMQQLNPGSAKEESGELYKVVGNRNASQNNTEGPYTRGDEAPLAANSGWTQRQRYEWTMSLQDHAWKGSKPVCDLIEGMWTARGDTPSTHSFASNATSLANAKAWFTTNWDMETTLTSMALLEWMSIWDDAAQNHFFWRRADGTWSRLGWDYDQVMSSSSGGGGGGGSMGGTATQTIYGGEYGATTVFDGVNWWKDTFYKCFRSEYQQRLWELNNSFCDATNLTALGCPTAATFAASRKTYVNTQLAALGTYYKPTRPTNSAPAGGAVIVGATDLATSAYAHPQPTAHAATRWEIRTAAGDYEEPVLRQTSTTKLTALAVPFDQLTYGQTYYWRATHIDANGHPSIVSAETSFTWGTASTTAGALVLNEVLAINRNALRHGSDFPDYVELRNNGATATALTGCALTDDPFEPAKYVFPSGTSIAAGGYLLVWCDSDTTTSGLHTGFGLNGDGDQILLLNASAAIVDSLTFGPQAPDVSLGRIVNGTGGWQANTPTPGTANSARTLGALGDLCINEWLADPAYGEDWFEVHNRGASVVALAGLYLSDTPSTPTLTQIPVLSFIAPGGFTRFYADGSTAGGNHCNFKLSKSGESLVLTGANGVTALDTVTFSTQATDVSQGRLPDGGSNIVSFAAQTTSPGYPNWAPTPVVINEVLAHAAAPLEDAIEIANPGTSAVSIGGWWLSDDLAAPMKYQVPAGMTVPAGGFVVVYEASLNAGAAPFSLSAFGDEVLLSATDADGALTGYRSLARFGASPENTSFGRVGATGLNGSSGGAEFWPQTSHTFGQDNPASVSAFRTGTGSANGLPQTGPVTINEIMYHPLDDAEGEDNTRDEFVELQNLTTVALDLGGWRLKGDSEFIFPAGTTLAPESYLLLVSFDPADSTALAAFRTTYGLSAATVVLGPYSEPLANSTHDVEIAYPATIDEATAYILVDKVEYRDLAPWPTAPDGSGTSLQRCRSSLIGNSAANWVSDVPTPGAANPSAVADLAIGTTSPLPGGIVGTAYTSALAATGGTPPYAWTLAVGDVPGLSLSSGGTLSGTPVTAGTYTLTVTVTDAAASSATGTFSLTIVADPPRVTTTSPLPDGEIGATYSQTLVATGGTPPYTWSLQAGALPVGLTLNGAGVISGTPSAPGTFAFTVQATDDAGLSGTQELTITVPVPPLAITSTSPVVTAELGAAYSQALTATGGITPYAWDIAAGALPSGLTLSTAGTLSGTAAAAGTFVFTAQVTDAAGTLAAAAFTLAVVPPDLVITTAALPAGVVGEAYTQTLAATGGVAPYAWSLPEGGLPEGLALAADGALSGTPTTAGTYSLNVAVADSLGTVASASFRLTVGATGPLDHFTWDVVPTTAYAGNSSAVRFTARDTAERLVTSFNGSADLQAADGLAATTSPVLISELGDGAESQFELQNVTATAADTRGWYVLLGDSQTDINTVNPVTYALPDTVAAGGLLRLTEQDATTDGRIYFGGPIGWSSAADEGKAWIMLIDGNGVLRDVVVTGWTAADLATLSVEINGAAVPVSGHWHGDGLLPGTRAAAGTTLDSWQRTGRCDRDLAADWTWSHNGDGSDATGFGVANAGLAVPLSTATALAVSPTSVTLSDGEYRGFLLLAESGSAVRLTATAADGEAGTSEAFAVQAGTDSDGDAVPDLWETEHGLAVGSADAELDADADGQSNLAEYLAGTDPRSFASRLAITAIAVPASDQVTVTWSGVAGRLYRFMTSTDLVTWTALDTTVLLTTGGTQTTTIATGGAVRLFVRIEVVTSL